jgi:hypothetical protein
MSTPGTIVLESSDGVSITVGTLTRFLALERLGLVDADIFCRARRC